MPVIQSIAAFDSPASPGGDITVHVVGQSATNLPLSYGWNISGAGWSLVATATQDTVIARAPATYGSTATITITITDTDNRTAIGTIGVSTIGNSGPTISTIVTFPPTIISTASLRCAATDPNNDPLSFNWSIGGVSGIASGADTTWKSPGIPGYYNVNVTASDYDKSATGSTYVNIGSTSAWPKFRRDIQGSGLTPLAFERHDVVLDWTFATPGSIYSSPAIGYDERIYFTSTDGWLYAVQRGNLVWRYLIGPGAKSSPVITPDGTVYVGSPTGYLYALRGKFPNELVVNPTWGLLKWRFQTGQPITSSPAVAADGTVYIGSRDGYFYAIRSNGTVKWRFKTGTEINGVPLGVPVESPASIAPDGTIYFGSFDGTLYALRADGTLKWRFKIETVNTQTRSIYSAPAIAPDGSIYFGSMNNYVYALESNGSLRWKFKTGPILTGSNAAFVTASVAIGPDGVVYVGSGDGFFYALYMVPIPPPPIPGGRTPFIPPLDETQGGILKWKFATGGPVTSSAAVSSDGAIYFGASNGDLIVLQYNGTVLFRRSTGGAIRSSPSLGQDGNIYIGSDDGKLYVFKSPD